MKGLKTEMFELEQAKQRETICRLSGHTGRHGCSFEVIDTENKVMVKVMGIDSLKKIRDRLDRYIFMLDAMETDLLASEMQVSDLYGNNISIRYALEHGLLKRR